MTEIRDGLTFGGQPLEGLAPLPTEEISINTLIPTHFNPVTAVRLNGQPYTGAAIRLRTKAARLDVDDHGFRYRIEYRFTKPTLVRLDRWAKFLRFAGVWYAGRPRRFTVAQLARLQVHGRLRVRP